MNVRLCAGSLLMPISLNLLRLSVDDHKKYTKFKKPLQSLNHQISPSSSQLKPRTDPFFGVMPVWRTVTTMDDLVKLLEQHETQRLGWVATTTPLGDGCCRGRPR